MLQNAENVSSPVQPSLLPIRVQLDSCVCLLCDLISDSSVTYGGRSHRSDDFSTFSSFKLNNLYKKLVQTQEIKINFFGQLNNLYKKLVQTQDIKIKTASVYTQKNTNGSPQHPYITTNSRTTPKICTPLKSCVFLFTRTNSYISSPRNIMHISLPASNQISHSCQLTGNVTFRQFSFSWGIQTLGIFFIALAFFVCIHCPSQRKRDGLYVWPFIGMLPSLLNGLRSKSYEWITRVLCQQNGTFVFIGPWLTSLNCVVTSDPQNIEYLLKTKFMNFHKGKFFRNNVYDLLGDGIVNADDENWRRQRKTTSIEFHSSEFRKLTYESLIELVHSRLLPVLEESIKKGSSIDLQDVLLRLTFDNICMIAFGVDPGCLHSGLPEIPFAKAFEDATEITMLRFISPSFVWKAMRYFNIGPERKLKESICQVDKFAEEVIHTRKNSNSEKNSKSNLLTMFMRLKDDDKKPFSDKFLRDICVNFILAGRDTSSVALSWFFWLLDQNPDVEKRIFEEIRSVISQREKSDDERGENRDSVVVFRPEEVKKMDYLHAALSEALRLYPSVPLDHKEVVEDEAFPDGTVLKKGTKIVYVIYAMGRMESIWGKDCREYKPERWLQDGRLLSESAYKFTAFNGGPRLCLGKDFAYYQMKFVAASIIYRYRVKVIKNHAVVPKLALTMSMKYGLKVTLNRRDNPEAYDHTRDSILPVISHGLKFNSIFF